MKHRKSALIAVVVAAILTTSGMAMAEHIESHDEDTLLSFGYDETNHIGVLNLGGNDTLFICQYEDGDLSLTYGDDTDGVIPVDAIEDAEGTKTFEPRPGDELADGLVEATEPAEYTGADGECGVIGTAVAGPNGQINHGQYLKAIKSLFDIQGQGCIVRYIAQSDIGRTETSQINVPDVDPDFEASDTGTVTMSTFEADCLHGQKDHGDDWVPPGQAKKAENASTTHGKSGDAPGHND